SARRDGEHNVEKTSPSGGTPGDKVHVGGREHCHRQRAHGIAEPVAHDTIEAHALAPAGTLEADADLAHPVARHARAEVKTGRPETNEILVARTPHRTQELQIVDRLEKVRFSLTVLADDEHAGRW